MKNRKAAIEWLSMLKEKFVKTEYEGYLDMAISALEKQERDRWHSVAKEGNPKESGFYLWTSKDGTVREDYYQVRDDTWSKAWQFGYEVIAWKKEPEPYTEEEA